MKNARRILLVLAAIVLAQAQTRTNAPEGRHRLPVLPRVSVTALVDNMSGSGAVLGEWGIAFLVQTDGHQVLFDTGAGRVLLGNARALGVDLRKTDSIVISHNHDDHTGGLKDALEACGPVSLFIHPAGFRTGFWKDNSRAVAYTLPFSREALGRRVSRLIETRDPAMVCGGVMVTGQIPRVTEFEDTGVNGQAFLDSSLETPDGVLDDQALFFRVPEGVVILLGCAHSGLVNTMRYVAELLGEEKIYGVIGGTHLIGASPARIQKTVDALKKYDVQKIMLSHCTGVQAYAAVAKAFPERCDWPSAGTRIHLGK